MTKSLRQRADRTPRVQIRGERAYWEPSASLRRHGFKSAPIGILSAEALAQADTLNTAADLFLATAAGERPAAQSLADIVARYTAPQSPAMKPLAPRTRADYQRHLARACQTLGHMRADTLTRQAIDKWHSDLAAISADDARNSLGALRAALAWSVAKGHIGSNPALGIKAAPRIRRNRIAERRELWAMIRAAEQMNLPSIAAIALTCTATMQRVDDTLNLRHDQIKSGVLYITQSKTGAQLSFRLHSLVAERLGSATDSGLSLFPNERTQSAYSLRAFERAWNRVRDVAASTMPSLAGADPSVREPTLRGALDARDLRRSGMVWAAQGGASIAQICSVSGHTLQSGLEILETYLPRQRLLADQATNRLDLIRTPTIDDIAGQITAQAF